MQAPNKLRLVLIVLGTSIVLHSAVPAARLKGVPEGGIIIRIPDTEPERCINASTDRLSLHLRRLRIRKDIGWFTADKEAGLISGTAITGLNADGSEHKVTYPRMFTVTVEAFDEGFVSLPVEQRFFHMFKLQSGDLKYTSVDLDFVVLKKKKRARFGVALHHLSQITKKLPAPSNPFSDTFKFFADYADGVVSESINSNNNVGGQTKEGTMVFSFSLDGTCTGDMETTGTKLAIKGAAGSEEDGFADIRKNYCWKASLTPSFEVSFASMPANGDCATVAVTKFKKLRNPYYGFFLNKYTPPATSTGSVDILEAMGSGDFAESYRRCEQHGIGIEECLLAGNEVPR